MVDHTVDAECGRSVRWIEDGERERMGMPAERRHAIAETGQEDRSDSPAAGRNRLGLQGPGNC